jgi:hypothetical protein
VIDHSSISTPLKRFIKRSQTELEKLRSQNTLLEHELNETRSRLSIRRERKTGKRVALKGKYVLNTQEILEEVEKAEKETLRKKKGKGRKSPTPTPEIEEEIELDSEDELA